MQNSIYTYLHQFVSMQYKHDETVATLEIVPTHTHPTEYNFL